MFNSSYLYLASCSIACGIRQVCPGVDEVWRTCAIVWVFFHYQADGLRMTGAGVRQARMLRVRVNIERCFRCRFCSWRTPITQRLILAWGDRNPIEKETCLRVECSLMFYQVAKLQALAGIQDIVIALAGHRVAWAGITCNISFPCLPQQVGIIYKWDMGWRKNVHTFRVFS